MIRLVPVLALVAGCSTTPAPMPPAPIQPAPVICQVPDKHTVIAAKPAKPQGEYAQKDVADYLTKLHLWAARGWLQVESIKQWSNDCVQRERLRAGE